MDKPTCKLVGAPCGHHGQYTFYKAIRMSGAQERIIAIGDFFFVKLWQDSELVSVGELQLLWTDRAADQTLVSLRLYFLPENTPEGRNGHGEDEVLAISEKVVLRAEDLGSWVCGGQEWRWGLRAVWRGACAPPVERDPSQPLHRTRLDFTDVRDEKRTIPIDENSPGVVVFSYPQYCRYRALVSRLEGAHAHWLRQSLVAALGGYAAPTANTRILYCRDTFEYPELEGHEFVCNHLAPKLKGRPRGRRRRRARSRSHSRTSRSSESDGGKRSPSEAQTQQQPTPRRLSLRNGRTSDEEDEKRRAEDQALDKTFMRQLKAFYKTRGESFRMAHGLKELSLRALYEGVSRRGGYAAVTRRRAWRSVHAALRPRPPDASSTKTNYERFLLAYENHQRRTGTNIFNCSTKSATQPAPAIVDTIDVTESPLRETTTTLPTPAKRLRTPSPQLKAEDLSEPKKPQNTDEKPAASLNREFLNSLPPKEEIKLTLKPVELLLDTKKDVKLDTKYLTFPEDLRNNEMIKSFAEDNSALIAEIADKYNLKDSSKILEEIASKQGLSDGSSKFLAELAQKLNLGHPDSTFVGDLSLRSQSSAATLNGHPADSDQNSDQKGAAKPAGRSSLRSVRVKPARSLQPASTTTNTTPPMPPLRPDSASSSPPVTSSTCNPTNFGINYPPSTSTSTSTCSNQVTSTNNQDAASDDEIVEVPYKPKTPEIIDLDEYPESPQSVKKKKLDILKERGLEVTPIPNAWTAPVPVVHPNPMLLNPAVQHQIMTQAQLFQMYNILPSYSNGVQPPKVIQGKSIFGTSGPEKTVYGNPKDPFMPPPHILQGTPIKPSRNIPTATQPTPQDILDLTCKTSTAVSPQKPTVEIVKVPRVPSPTKSTPAQNLTKNYTLVDGKAVVGSNLEITLVSPKQQTPVKNRPPQKRSSNGKFVSTKTPTTPTPPKDAHSKSYKIPSPSNVQKDTKPNIIVPNYQINSTRDEPSPTGSTGSSTSQSSTLMQNNFLQTVYKGQNNLAQLIEMQKAGVPSLPFIDPMYMSAIYSSLAGQMDQRQLAMYRDLMASQFRSYPALLNMGAVSNTPTTKN